jgi:hypothetical protein
MAASKRRAPASRAVRRGPSITALCSLRRRSIIATSSRSRPLNSSRSLSSCEPSLRFSLARFRSYRRCDDGRVPQCRCDIGYLAGDFSLPIPEALHLSFCGSQIGRLVEIRFVARRPRFKSISISQITLQRRTRCDLRSPSDITAGALGRRRVVVLLGSHVSLLIPRSLSCCPGYLRENSCCRQTYGGRLASALSLNLHPQKLLNAYLSGRGR